MADTELLGIYLNDHLAGASAGTELAQKISEHYADTKFGPMLAELASDIEQDRVTLAELMERLGIQHSAVKQAAGWVSEKLTRVKLSDAMTGSAELKRLLECETLSLGIEGKHSMWLSLQEIRDHHPVLASTDLDGLAERAQNQRSRIEQCRVDAANKAFV